MKFYVYELVRKSDGKVLYVGKGSGRRMDLHRFFASGGKTIQQRSLYSALRSVIDSGDDFFGRKVFESDDEGEVLQKEVEIINKYGLDNLLNGVSAHIFGITNSQKAAQVRQAISKARIGMKFSDTHRQRISQAQTGRKQSPEWIKHNADARRGQKREPYHNKLSPEESERLRLAKYHRYYQKNREQRLAYEKAQNGALRLQKWQAHLQDQGLPLDTPLPSRLSPLSALSSEQRLERKRARERLNHALRRARAEGNQAEIDRLTAERRALDAQVIESIVDCLTDS